MLVLYGFFDKEVGNGVFLKLWICGGGEICCVSEIYINLLLFWDVYCVKYFGQIFGEVFLGFGIGMDDGDWFDIGVVFLEDV